MHVSFECDKNISLIYIEYIIIYVYFNISLIYIEYIIFYVYFNISLIYIEYILLFMFIIGINAFFPEFIDV